MIFVSNEELATEIPAHILPDHLGGRLKLEHDKWLRECDRLVADQASTCNCYYYFQSPPQSDTTQQQQQATTSGETSQSNSSSNNNSSSSSSEDIEVSHNEAKDDQDQDQDQGQDDEYDKNGMNADELLAHCARSAAAGLADEFKWIRMHTQQQLQSSRCDAFREAANVAKNRYRDVVCLDETRVRLDSEEEQEVVDDYIHANFVNGWRGGELTPRAYISTQGPLDETIAHFWRMVWQERVRVVAMTTKCVELGKLKCAQYWPEHVGQRLTTLDNHLTIVNHGVQLLANGDFRLTQLRITHLKLNETRTVSHCQFLSWPDHGVPKTALKLIEFIELVRKCQRDSTSLSHSVSPICVHCSAGIGRTGTFIAIDIGMRRLRARRRLLVDELVKSIREQRAQSVQMSDQYAFCYMALIEYARRERLFTAATEETDLNALFEQCFS